MYTSHHDRNHCFEETRDGTLEVRVRGDSLPRDILGRLYIVCAILRQLALVLWILQFERDTYDIIFVDQLSACVPLLKWLSSSRVSPCSMTWSRVLSRELDSLLLPFPRQTLDQA